FPDSDYYLVLFVFPTRRSSDLDLLKLSLHSLKNHLQGRCKRVHFDPFRGGGGRLRMMNRAYALLVVHMQKFSRHSSYSFRSIRLVSLPELSSVFCFDGTAHSLLSQFFRNVVVFSRLFYDSISRQTVLLDKE